MSRKKEKITLDDLPKFSNPEELQALSAEDQEKVDRYFSQKIPVSETRALTPAERAQFDRRVGRKPGRPKIGQGAKVVAVTLEKGFLKRVDSYARRYKLKRSELIVLGLRHVMDAAPEPAKPRPRKSA